MDAELFWSMVTEGVTVVVSAAVILAAGTLFEKLASYRRVQRQRAKEELDTVALAASKNKELEVMADQLLKRRAGWLVAKPAVEELINNYHEQALDQARAQFWFSVAAATVGFIWILFSGASIQPDKLITVSKTFPGVVMDAVAFLFFRQASETRQRATELYDRLRSDKQMAESSSIVASIEDVRLRSAVKAQLALHMSGLEPKPIDLGAFLSGVAASATLTLQPTDDERLNRKEGVR